MKGWLYSIGYFRPGFSESSYWTTSGPFTDVRRRRWIPVFEGAEEMGRGLLAILGYELEMPIHQIVPRFLMSVRLLNRLKRKVQMVW
jgi:hypothetical protein